MAGAPRGNQNAHKGRRFRAAIDKALRGDPKQLDRIVKRLLALAEAGEAFAVREVADRLDGKAIAQIDVVNTSDSIAAQLREARARLASGRQKGTQENQIQPHPTGGDLH